MTALPDDTEGLREQMAESIHATSMCEQGDPAACGGGCHDLADTLLAVVSPVLERQRAEIEQLRTAKRHLSERISQGQEGWNELHREVERLRAELAEARQSTIDTARKLFDLGTLILRVKRDGYRQRAEQAEAERDLLRETLAETDLGSRVLALGETVAAADADRDELKAAVERAERLRDKWLGYPMDDMHYAAGLMLSRHLSGEAFTTEETNDEH